MLEKKKNKNKKTENCRMEFVIIYNIDYNIV